MAPIERSRLSRRSVLTGTAALLAAGITAAPDRAAAEGAPNGIRAAAVLEGDPLVLTAEGEESTGYAVRRIRVVEGRAELGEHLDIAFPDRFHPHSMAAIGATLWITGAVEELDRTVTVDNRIEAVPPELRGRADPGDADPDLPDGVVDIAVYRSSPALLRIESGRVDRADLPVPERIRSGAATAVTTLGGGALAVAIDGSPDPEAAVITRSHLAVSADGRTWRDRTIAEGLGEGFGTVLASAGARLYAVSADRLGDQSVYSGEPDAELELLAAEPAAGRPMAAVLDTDDRLTVYSDDAGRVRQTRYGRGRGTEETGLSRGSAGEVIAVQGRQGAWLQAEAGTMRARGLG